MKVNIKTKDYILRNYRLTDIDDLARNANDKAIGKFMSRFPYPYSRKDARQFITRNLKRDQLKPSKGVNMGLVVNNELVGGIGTSFDGHISSIGYWVAKKYRGTGLSRKAVKEVIKLLFEKKFVRIEAKTFLKNSKSQQLLLDLGFEREGILRKNVKKNGRYLDVYIFSKTK